MEFKLQGYWRSGRGWVEELTPLKYEEAKNLAEMLMQDAYEMEFGKSSEAEEKTLTVELSAENRQKLEAIRSQTGKSFGTIINQMVEDFQG